MSGFLLSPDAMNDLGDIRTYLREIPADPALRVARQLQKAMQSIGSQPYLGTAQSELTRLLGQEVRSRLIAPYRIFYRMGASFPEIVAILHTARNIREIMANRLQ